MHMKKPAMTVCIGPECPGCDSPECMAEGGAVGSGKQRKDFERGVHRPAMADAQEDEDQGQSPAGSAARGMKELPMWRTKFKRNASDEHRRVMEEQSDMPKPKLMAEGGMLDANARKHIAAKNFAGPDRSYPIEDQAHARNALARVAQHGSPALQAEVRRKVHAKYPGIGEDAHGGMMADGGMPDEMDIDADPIDDELSGMLGEELCQAFESKDKKRIMEAVEAAVLSVLSRVEG